MKHRKSVGSVPTLAPLPGDFSWRLLGLLLGSLSSQLDEQCSAAIAAVLRRRDAVGYHCLDKDWGLQRIASNRNDSMPAGNPAVVRLLTSMLKKDCSLETSSAAERKRKVLGDVIALDLELANRKFEPLESDPVFQATRRILGEILGPTPSLEDVSVSARHGPGSTTEHRYTETSSYFKYGKWPYAVSTRAQSMLRACIEFDPRWLGALEQSYRQRYSIAPWAILNWDVFWKNILIGKDYNMITSVPKDGTKDRPIAIEPPGSVYLQLGVEGLIRSRLNVFGVDLNSQKRNRDLAREASLNKTQLGAATFDLSNASDTVSRDLVRRLLPQGWFDLLDSVRSPYGMLPDGTAWIYSKMSSMGNGSTFALESLLFFALLLAVSEKFGSRSDRKIISVFGDDLIFPRYLASPVRIYLEAFGFKVNLGKSFFAGSFYESCGEDWLNGINIRPVFIQKPEHVCDLIGIRNRLNRWFVCHLGCSLPLSVDSFLLGFCRGQALLGPEDEEESDSWIHCNMALTGGPLSIRVLRRSQPELPGKEFWFRKLMHDLKSCTSEASRFGIKDRRSIRTSVVSRVLYPRPYRVGGVPQDYARPEWPGNVSCQVSPSA